MTPKEKAQDLVNQFRIVLMDEDTECGNEILCTSIAIKNALITVSNIISELETIHCYGENDIKDAIQWYEEVQKELEEL
jgi:hypothetical protein